MSDPSTYTGFEVYPLYNEKDEVAYFLIEFQPLGFAYVATSRCLPFFTIFGMVGMYTLEEGEPWRRYRLSIDGVEPPPYNGREWRCEDPVGYGPTGFGFVRYPDRRWEVDEEGEFIYYNVSHFKAANINDEKRYLLKVEIDTGGYINVVAIKRGEKYLNLVSMEEMELTGKVKADTCAEAEIYFTYSGQDSL